MLILLCCLFFFRVHQTLMLSRKKMSWSVLPNPTVKLSLCQKYSIKSVSEGQICCLSIGPRALPRMLLLLTIKGSYIRIDGGDVIKSQACKQTDLIFSHQRVGGICLQASNTSTKLISNLYAPFSYPKTWGTLMARSGW